jgi:hypothetical protein
MAKAITRLEFGRFYTDDAREREVARSLARARARREPPQVKAFEPAKPNSGPPTKGKAATKPAPRSQLAPRERRTERAEAMARIAAAAKLREEKDGR